MKQLTDAQVRDLQSFKYVEDGSNKFFDYIEDLYKDDFQTMAEIKKCRDMKDSIEWMVNYPSHVKAELMFSSNMDDLLAKIGYYGEKSTREHIAREFDRSIARLIDKHSNEFKAELERLVADYVAKAKEF